MLQVIDNRIEFEELREEWNELLAASASAGFFLTHEWLLTWWKHLGGRRRLRLMIVREDGRLLAIAPVAVSPPSARILLPLSRTEFLGTGSVGSDHLDLIVRKGREDDALEELGARLTLDKRMIHLDQVRDGVSAVSILTSRLRARGWRLAQTAGGLCPFVELSGLTWDTYLAGLGREHRYAFRRKLKAVSSRFELRFEEIRSEDRRREALPILVELHENRWWRKGESEAFCTPALRAFHDEISRLALERGCLRLQILWLDDRPAAAIYGFVHGGVFSFYQSGFDSAFSDWSVGLVAMGLSIKSALEEGAKEYDLLHGSEKYKFHWAARTRELRRWDMYPPRGRGLACRMIVSTSRAARRGARRIVSSTAGLWSATRNPVASHRGLRAQTSD